MNSMIILFVLEYEPAMIYLLAIEYTSFLLFLVLVAAFFFLFIIIIFKFLVTFSLEFVKSQEIAKRVTNH